MAVSASGKRLTTTNTKPKRISKANQELLDIIQNGGKKKKETTTQIEVKQKTEDPQTNYDEQEIEQEKIISKPVIETIVQPSTISMPEMQELFGMGFQPNDYKQMYTQYVNLQNNYPLKTAMHKDALIRVVKYGYKEAEAIAEDNPEAAAKWGKLCKDARTDAKMNPSQLSAADLSDGMTSFSQLSAMVERAQDIIPLLPQFIEQPKDRVDYTLWEYVNYIRHLDGKPLIEYKELYKFLEVRYESLKKRYKFMKKENNGNFDEEDGDTEV